MGLSSALTIARSRSEDECYMCLMINSKCAIRMKNDKLVWTKNKKFLLHILLEINIITVE